MDSVIFQDLLFGNDKNVLFFSLAMVESNFFFFIVDIVLPVESFLLSFLLKSCYLKKKKHFNFFV